MDLLVVELTLGAVAGYALWEAIKDWTPRWPTPQGDPVVALDRVHSLHPIPPAPQAPTMESARYRLRGRPDELRRAPDGRLVPVAIKSGRAPWGGPHASNRAQLLAYCLLVEEKCRIPPPYGILCHGDGTEFRVAWDAHARADILAGLVRLGELYMGEMDPTPWKCRACSFGKVYSGGRTAGVA